MLKSIISMKRMMLLFWLCILGCGLAACGTDKNGSKISDDGRSYGGLIHGEIGEKLETAFFDMTVEGVEKYDTYQFNDGLYQAEEGNTYLVVTLTLENTYDEAISMSLTDFVLDFEGNESEEILIGYGRANLNQDSFMDNIFTLKEEETVTKSIVYVVKDIETYTLRYSEYYEDEFKGDTFEVVLSPKKLHKNEGDASTEQVSEEEDSAETSNEDASTQAQQE